MEVKRPQGVSALYTGTPSLRHCLPEAGGWVGETASRSSTRRRIGIQCQGKIIFSKGTVCRAASPRRRRPHRGRAAIASFPFS